MPDETASSLAVAEFGTEFRSVAEAFVDVAERALSSGPSHIPSAALERVLTAAMKLYVAKAEAEGTFPAPVSADKITPTEVVVVVSELLRAANLSLFDLAMWYRRAR
jgi:hypothetical protein